MLYFSIACLGVGVLAGFLGGMLGIGGGVVIVPALILLFDQMGLFQRLAPDNSTTLIAVGTSLATIIFTSAAAARAQIRARMVEWPVVKTWTPGLMLGGFCAGYVAALLPMLWLRGLIAGFLLLIALIMLANWRPASQRNLPGPWPSSLIGAGVGLVSGIAGIGGGNLTVPTLVYFNTPVHRATATSSTLGLPIALAGTLGYVARGWSHTELGQGLLGYVYLPALAMLMLAVVASAPLGVRAAHRLPAMALRRLFALLLMLVSVRMFWSAL